MRLSILSFVLLATVNAFAAAATQETSVGPNILVSRESGYPNVELMVAANPKNPKNLVGTAIVTTAVGDRCTVYTSMDAGNTWKSVDFPWLPEDGTGDPQVAFGVDGTAYFSVLGRIPDEQKKKHMALLLFRSTDGGLTWEKAGVYGSGHGADHDQMVLDPRLNHAGTLYTTCLCSFGDQEWNIGLFRSADKGNHTTGPMRAAVAPPGMGVFNLNPIVLSDGFLFVPFYVFEPKRLEERTSPTFDIYFTTTSDEGATFSAPANIRTLVLDPKAHVPSRYGSVVFAADTYSTAFHDRIYMLLNDAVAGRYTLRLSYSNDRGKTWSAPKAVVARQAGADEYQPAISVNRYGVVGISWFETADSSQSYREYLAASLDGGESFLPAVSVSAQPSPTHAPGNDILRHTIDSPSTNAKGDIVFSFAVTNTGFPIAGEYMGLVADDSGKFHPFWSDARTGSFQVWTASVKIVSTREPAQADGSTNAASNSPPLGEKLSPVFDPAKYDRQTGIEEIPVRFKNNSADVVCRPLLVQIHGQDESARAPQILNADNGKPWNGAAFDYSGALGDFPCLEPGGITAAKVWRIKVADPSDPFLSFQISINGTTAPPASRQK